MTRLSVYGVDDNLLCVEELNLFSDDPKAEAFYAEFDCAYGDLDDGPRYLGFSDGTLLRVSYDGQWHIVILEPGKCKVTHRGATDLEDDNSDVVILYASEGFTWVICSRKMERLSGQLDFFAS